LKFAAGIFIMNGGLTTTKNAETLVRRFGSFNLFRPIVGPFFSLIPPQPLPSV